MALFLSGYTIQQRTLQDLRVAIRPGSLKPSPKAHLPGYFKREMVKLQDGTVIVQESQADRDEKERMAKKFELHEPNAKTKSKKNQKPIEIAKPIEEKTPKEKKESDTVQTVETKDQATEEQLRMLDIIKKQAAQQAWGVDHPDPQAKNPLPITRAERRKLIKDEIQRLAQADRPVLYQRRLW